MLRPYKVVDIPATTVPWNHHSDVDGHSDLSSDYPYPFPSYRTKFEVLDSQDKKSLGNDNYCRHYNSDAKVLSLGQKVTVFVNHTDASSGLFINDVGYIPTPYMWGDLYDPNTPKDSSGRSCAETFGPWIIPVSGLPSLVWGPSGEGLPSLTPYHIRAFNAMMPGIKPAGNTSLLNSIIELKDFGSLPKTLSNIRKSLLSARALKGLVLNTGKTLRQLLRAGADAYLQAEFNILPLLSDIASVRQALLDTRSQLKQLTSRANQPQKRHFYANLVDPSFVDSNTPWTGLSVSYNTPRQYLANRNVRYTEKQYNATIEYSYSLPSWVNEDSLIQALADRLGVNLNPRIIWNAIPWSFVVDWVLNVNQYLDNFRSRNIEPVVYVRRACFSVHVTRLVATSLGPLSYNPCVSLSEESYIRFPYFPDMLSLINSSGLSSNEFSLAAALAITR